VKLVPAFFAAKRGAVKTLSAVVLQITFRRDPSAAVGVRKISLLAVTAVVLTTQVPVEAAGSQEKAPAGAEPQATNDGFAPVPAAAQLVALW